MSADRLADLIPSRPWWRRAVTYLGFLTLIVVLSVSWRQSRIDPLKFWNEREKGWEHVFGVSFDDTERATFREQAQREAAVLLQDAATDRVRAQTIADGRPFSPMAQFREIEAEAVAMHAAMSLAERQAQVEKRYLEILDANRGGYFPPDFSWPQVRTALKYLFETIAMAIWGTLFAFIAAVPAAVLAARNTLAILASGDGLWSRFLRWLAIFVLRRFFDASRGFNELVLGMIFIAIVGLGPFPGVLALAVHTFGILGKVFSEAIEAIEPGPIEGVSATGSGSVHTVAFAVAPQVMPIVISYSLLRFESNVRSATVLGLVGAGGIGFLIKDKFQGYMYRDVAMIMILVIATVSIIDALTNRLRARFI